MWDEKIFQTGESLNLLVSTNVYPSVERVKRLGLTLDSIHRKEVQLIAEGGDWRYILYFVTNQRVYPKIQDRNS